MVSPAARQDPLQSTQERGSPSSEPAWHTGARIQSTASEGQAHYRREDLLEQTAKYWQDRDTNSNKAD